GNTLLAGLPHLPAERQKAIRDVVDRTASDTERTHYRTEITIAGLQDNYDALWAVIDNPNDTVNARRSAIRRTSSNRDPRSRGSLLDEVRRIAERRALTVSFGLSMTAQSAS